MTEGACTVVKEPHWPHHEALYGPDGRLLEEEFGQFGDAHLASFTECTSFARRTVSEDGDIRWTNWYGEDGIVWPPRLDDLRLEPA